MREGEGRGPWIQNLLISWFFFSWKYDKLRIFSVWNLVSFSGWKLAWDSDLLVLLNKHQLGLLSWVRLPLSTKILTDLGLGWRIAHEALTGFQMGVSEALCAMNLCFQYLAIIEARMAKKGNQPPASVFFGCIILP